MDIKTLDERIRERARNQCRNDVRNAMAGTRKLFQIGYALQVDVYGAKTTPAAMDLLDLLEKAAIEVHTHEYEEKAVRGFVDRVDQLQGEVNELRNAVEEV